MAKSTKKTKPTSKNGYDKLPAMMLYVKDWMGDANLRRAGLEAKGIWIDFMCMTFNMDRRGVFTFARLSEEAINLLDSLLEQKDKQNFSDASILLADMLLLNEEFCSTFADVFGYPRETFARPLARLLLAGVARVEPIGFIYSKRMVRDEDVRQKRATAGSKGGKATQQKNRNVVPASTNTKAEEGVNFASTFASPKSEANTANAITPIIVYNNKKEKSTEISTKTEEVPSNEFGIPNAVWTFYNYSFAQLENLGPSVSRGLTPEIFQEWKDIVDLILGQNLTHLFTAQYFFPVRYLQIRQKGFTKQNWQNVLEEVAARNVTADIDLASRITVCMRDWMKIPIKGPSVTPEIKPDKKEFWQNIHKTNMKKIEKEYEAGKITQAEYTYLKENLQLAETPSTKLNEYRKNIAPQSRK